MSCLSNQEINFPDSSYKSGDPSKLGRIVCRSGGSFPENRISTAYTSTFNPSGKFEYYINSLDFQAIISYDKRAGGTNATTFEFEVVEPYSMGIFLQSMQLAAAESDQINYLESPFLLTVEFIGYVDDGPAIQIPLTTRHIPIKLSTVEMDVSSAGCKYRVSAYAWNELALTDQNNHLKGEVSISGATVQEILQNGKNSLQKVLNSRAKEMTEKEKTKSVPDEIVILFPKESSSSGGGGAGGEDAGATANPNAGSGGDVLSKLSVSRIDNNSLEQSGGDLNEIGSSKMGFDMSTSGQSAAIKDNTVFDEATGRYKRGKITYDPKSRTYIFAQGTSIVTIINEIVMTSEFAKKAAEDNKKDGAGFKTWFRVETQVYNIDPNDGNKGKGRTPRMLIYRVVPYKVHSSRFSSPTSPGDGYDQLKQQAPKEYNYIYTGKNTEIIDFNINLQAGFFSTVYADQGLLNRSTAVNGRDAAGKRETKEQTPSNENLRQGQEKGVGSRQQGELIENARQSGGGPGDDARTLVARQFQDALLNSPADLLTVDLTIMGDPFYIADSGMGNFSNSGSGGYSVTSTGAIDYQSNEVDILLNFRTPIDIDPTTGVMDFGNTEIVEGFSGLYQVMTLDNKFDNGKFVQTLNLVRRPKQNPTDAEQKAAASYGTSSGSQQTRMLADQDAYFSDDTDGGSATVNPKSKPTPKMESRSTSSSTGQPQMDEPNPEGTFYP